MGRVSNLELKQTPNFTTFYEETTGSPDYLRTHESCVNTTLVRQTVDCLPLPVGLFTQPFKIEHHENKHYPRRLSRTDTPSSRDTRYDNLVEDRDGSVRVPDQIVLCFMSGEL